MSQEQGKIYIVEDDMTIVSLLKDHLSASYHVSSVSNFRDVKQEIIAFQPDLILMDITLPYFNGFYWTAELRKFLTIPKQVVSKESLLEKLWENDSFIDQNTLNVNMTRLRKKIVPIGFDYIHTVRGVGYLLQ
ncbi:TPA: DNA-binding response regulator [Streptococcus agalactiae]|nr:DNA-binding response regulator [Streptococcus agalactiae]